MSNNWQSLTPDRLAASQHVKIHVGSEDAEKIYSLPRDLIAHYSPGYFGKCFQHNWKEANEGVLRLPDEDPEFFAVLCDYFHRGDATCVPKGNLNVAEEWRDSLRKCFAFIRFTDMYDVAEAATAIRDHLWTILSRRRFDDCVLAVGVEEMQFCTERLHSTNKALRVLANVCIRKLGGNGPTISDWASQEDDSVLYIHALMQKNDNLGAAMARQLRRRRGNTLTGFEEIVYYVASSPV